MNIRPSVRILPFRQPEGVEEDKWQAYVIERNEKLVANLKKLFDPKDLRAEKIDGTVACVSITRWGQALLAPIILFRAPKIRHSLRVRSSGGRVTPYPAPAPNPRRR